MKRKHAFSYSPTRAAGFTLIEFLVASVLAMIVIVAATGTYFLTRGLNHTAQQRLTVQQNLRNATTLIMRDARMVGAFGCYNTGSVGITTSSASSDAVKAPNFQIGTALTDTQLVLKADEDNTFGILKGTVQGQDALIFVYGLGETGVAKVDMTPDPLNKTISKINKIEIADSSDADTDHLRQTLKAGGNVVLSSCHNAYAYKLGSPVNNTEVPVNFDTEFTESDKGSMTISKLYASAYIHNKATKQLLRVDLGNDGKWQSPQLVSTGINSMDIGYGYTDNCNLDVSSTDPAYVEETFTYTNTIATTKDKGKLPSVVQVRLNYDVNLPAGTSGTSTTATTPATADYVINATIRGGNTCGERMPIN